MIIVIIAIKVDTKQITITLGVLTKRVLQNISRNSRGRLACFAVFQRATEGTEGHKGNRGPQRGQRAVEETEGHREYSGP